MSVAILFKYLRKSSKMIWRLNDVNVFAIDIRCWHMIRFPVYLATVLGYINAICIYYTKEAEEKHAYGSIYDSFNEERSVNDVYKLLGSSGSALRSSRGKVVRQYQLPETTLTKDQQTQLVDEMNTKRRGEKAADMYKLVSSL